MWVDIVQKKVKIKWCECGHQEVMHSNWSEKKDKVKSKVWHAKTFVSAYRSSKDKYLETFEPYERVTKELVFKKHLVNTNNKYKARNGCSLCRCELFKLAEEEVLKC